MYQIPEAEMVSDIQDHPVQPIFLQGENIEYFHFVSFYSLYVSNIG